MSYTSAIENEQQIFMNICKSLNEMMIDRKYTVSGSDLIPYDLETVNNAFQTCINSPNEHESVLEASLDKVFKGVSYNDNDRTFNVIVVFYLSGGKKGLDTFISNYVNHIKLKTDASDNTRILRIDEYSPTSKYIIVHRTESRKNDGISNVNMFYYKHVCFNLTRHIDQPLFVLLRKNIHEDNERIETIYKTYNLASSKIQTAEIKITDPVAQWFGATVNDIFILYRKRNPTDMNSMYIMYSHILKTQGLDNAVIDADVEFRIITRHSIKKGQKHRF